MRLKGEGRSEDEGSPFRLGVDAQPTIERKGVGKGAT